MFRELGWVVAFTTLIWILASFDRGSIAVGGEVLLVAFYYVIRHFAKPIINMTKEILLEFWNGWTA